jgi:hypothetical protein
VLIFERIKRMRGQAVAAAIKAGRPGARDIIDTRDDRRRQRVPVPFGRSGAGFCKFTLVVGLVANLFPTVFVSRAIFDVKLWRARLSTLSIGKELFRRRISTSSQARPYAGPLGCGDLDPVCQSGRKAGRNMVSTSVARRCAYALIRSRPSTT